MLPRPDIVFQLDADENQIISRENYGDEIYEKHEFQKNLRQEFKFFHNYKYWRIIEALRPKEEVNRQIIEELEKLLEYYSDQDSSDFDKNNYPNQVKEDLFSIKNCV